MKGRDAAFLGHLNRWLASNPRPIFKRMAVASPWSAEGVSVTAPDADGLRTALIDASGPQPRLYLWLIFLLPINPATTDCFPS